MILHSLTKLAYIVELVIQVCCHQIYYLLALYDTLQTITSFIGKISRKCGISLPFQSFWIKCWQEVLI